MCNTICNWNANKLLLLLLFCHFPASFRRPFCNFLLFRVIVSSFRRFVVSLSCFVSLSLLQFRLVVAPFRRFLVSIRHFDVSFRRFVSPFRFAVLTALDWEREKVKFACPLHEVVILVCPKWRAC